jgi:hypothetical protein
MPERKMPKDVARSKLPAQNLTKRNFTRNYTIIPQDKYLLATYSPARHAPTVALLRDSSSLVIEKLDVRYEFVFDEILGLA